MTNKVEILDAIMSSGKTTAILNWFDNNLNQRYIYVTPLLSEAEGRIADTEYGCKYAKFYSPEHATTTYFDEDGVERTISGKGVDFLRLLKEGKNVSCTHALFSEMTKHHLDWIKSQKYIVVLDEELDVISGLDGFTKTDKEFLLDNNTISIDDENGKVSWIRQVPNNGFKYGKFKWLCDEGMLYAAKRSQHMMVVQLPIELIAAAERFIVLSYLFKGSVFDKFLQLHKIDTADFTDVSVDSKGVKERIASLIEVVGLEYTNKFRTGSLSYNWYDESNNKLKPIETAIIGTAKPLGMKSEDVMYTFPKTYAYPPKKNSRKISPNGYKPESIIKGARDEYGNTVINKCWVDCSCRATNELANKRLLVHCLNRYPNAVVQAFLQDYGYGIDEDNFALSEMLQWMFRGCVRKGEKMYVCILSKRMLGLYNKWLESIK